MPDLRGYRRRGKPRQWWVLQIILVWDSKFKDKPCVMSCTNVMYPPFHDDTVLRFGSTEQSWVLRTCDCSCYLIKDTRKFLLKAEKIFLKDGEQCNAPNKYWSDTNIRKGSQKIGIGSWALKSESANGWPDGISSTAHRDDVWMTQL